MAEILRHVTVARDGMHNAFTDLQYWQQNYWVGYRKGAAHASTDGEAVVAVSADRQRFREVARLHVRGDCRDPKLLPVDENRLAAYFPSWVDGFRRRKLQQYITFSSNGYDWETPRPILDSEKWLWRVRPHQGRYYGLIQNLTAGWSDRQPPHELDLAVSDDLLDWQTVARIGDGRGLNESDLHFLPDGEAWLVSRTVKADEGTGSYFASAKPPYTDWEVVPMHPVVHAPVLLAHDDELYVAGRSQPSREGEKGFAFGGGHSLSVWRVRRGALELVLRIPATGDCSYPGMIKDAEGRICLSYYSQHAYHLGVVKLAGGVNAERFESASDVYFAELQLP